MIRKIWGNHCKPNLINVLWTFKNIKHTVLCWVTRSAQSTLQPRQAPLSMGFSRQEHWSGLPCPPPGYLLNPGVEFMSPTLQADSLLSEPPRKLRNAGVGSLSLLSGTCLTQESNQGLLHCRRILYQLSYQGSPKTYYMF